MGLKRSTAKSEKTRIRLLEAAVDVLSQRGLSELTLAALGASAGVTRGCVQYYFMTAQDLLAPLAKYVAERDTEIFEAACAGCSGDLIGFTLERAADRAADRYRKVRLELIASARFNPKLRSALAQRGRWSLDAAMLAHAARKLGDDGVADLPRFRAGSLITGGAGERSHRLAAMAGSAGRARRRRSFRPSPGAQRSLARERRLGGQIACSGEGWDRFCLSACA